MHNIAAEDCTMKKSNKLYVTFCLSLIMVNGDVLVMFRSSLKEARNHSQLCVDSTSQMPNAIGKIQSFGSIPTAVRIFPLYLVLM